MRLFLMFFTRIFIYFILLLGLISCSTPRHKKISHLHAGMEKADVLAMAGNPSYTRREGGKDIWYYEYYVKNIKHGRRLVIKNSFVVQAKEFDIGPGANASIEGSSNVKEYEDAVKKRAQDSNFIDVKED